MKYSKRGRCSTYSGWDAPAVHYNGYIHDPGFPDMMKHADQGGGVLWDSVVWPASEEVVIQSAGLWWIARLHMVYNYSYSLCKLLSGQEHSHVEAALKYQHSWNFFIDVLASYVCFHQYNSHTSTMVYIRKRLDQVVISDIRQMHSMDIDIDRWCAPASTKSVQCKLMHIMM